MARGKELQGKKKPRKEMRLKRRAMKAEINRLHMELSIHKLRNATAKRIQSRRFRVCQILDIFEAGIPGAAECVKERMAQRMIADLVEQGYVTFYTTEDRASRGINITAEITVLPPEI